MLLLALSCVCCATIEKEKSAIGKIVEEVVEEEIEEINKK